MRLDGQLRACYPDLDYGAIDVRNSDIYLWQRVRPCLMQAGWSEDKQADVIRSAYAEDWRSRPTESALAAWDAMEAMLTYPVGKVGLALGFFGATDRATCARYAWCDGSIAAAEWYPRLRALLLDGARAVTVVTLYVAQIHRTVASFIPFGWFSLREAAA